MKNNSLVIWNDVNVPVKRKMYHQKRSSLYKHNKRRGIGFCWDNGDIPVVVFNDITKQFEQVVNNRGLAYASRNQLRYQKGKKLWQ